MRKLLILGLIAAAAVFLSADTVLAGGGGKKGNGGNSKGTKKSSIKFVYEVDDDAVDPPALSVLVRPAGSSAITVGDLKAATTVEPGSELTKANLKPGDYIVTLALAEDVAAALLEVEGASDSFVIPAAELAEAVIDQQTYSVAAGEELEVFISAEGFVEASEELEMPLVVE